MNDDESNLDRIISGWQYNEYVTRRRGFAPAVRCRRCGNPLDLGSSNSSLVIISEHIYAEHVTCPTLTHSDRRMIIRSVILALSIVPLVMGAALLVGRFT